MRPSGFTGPGWIAKDNFSTSYLASFQKRHPAGLEPPAEDISPEPNRWR